MRVLVFVAAFAALAAAYETEHYRGHKLLSATPQDAAQVEVLHRLSQWRDVDMFSHHVTVGKKTVLKVPPASLAAFQNVLTDKNITHEISNHDVQESVNAESARQARALNSRVGAGKQQGLKAPTYEHYMRYDEIQQFMKDTAAEHGDIVLLETAGNSFEGRDTTFVRISKNGGTSPRAIVVDAGIHAREWIAPPVAIYLIQQLTQEKVANAALLDGLDWYIMPLANPDGYEYTHTKERFWRKNRSTKSSRWCPGTDVNRNFGYHYRESGASDWPCDETYPGPKAFSEIEAVNLRDWILNSNENKNAKMYLTLHSYGPYILYPWGYAFNLPDAEDKEELVSIANEANDAMVQAGSERFTVENSAQLYPAAGASDDWAKGEAGIAKAYTIELPGGGSNGFDMPADRIISVVQSTFEGIKVFAERAKKL